jgi:Zinc knuckle
VKTIKEKGSREIGVGRSLNGFCRYCGMQGHKASDSTVKKQRMNPANGNKGENMKNNCFNCGKPGHYNVNCPERKHNPMDRQQKLFVGYVGEDCVYMVQEENQLIKPTETGTSTPPRVITVTTT